MGQRIAHTLGGSFDSFMVSQPDLGLNPLPSMHLAWGKIHNPSQSPGMTTLQSNLGLHLSDGGWVRKFAVSFMLDAHSA